MASARRLLDNPAIQAMVCWAAASYIRLVWITGRWEVENTETLDSMIRDGKPFIICFWHGRLLMFPPAWRWKAKMNILISRHRDGRVIARALRHFGVGTIEGSTSRGGGRALRDLLRALRGGEYIGVTPDGPRGPRMRASAGVIRAARLADVPILPTSYAASRRRVLRSWDRFILALPFTRGVIRVGDPVWPAKSGDAADIEAVRAQLEDALNRLTATLDARFGHAPIEAAETRTSNAATQRRSAETAR
jgi:lysophospholipid acyltransferase (LPLAT)-like uncharacterized protein